MKQHWNWLMLLSRKDQAVPEVAVLQSSVWGSIYLGGQLVFECLFFSGFLC